MKRLITSLVVMLATLSMMGASVAVAQDAEVGDELPTEGEATPLGVEFGTLAPGSYEDDSFGPTVRFTIDEGWTSLKPDAEDVGFELKLIEIPYATFSVTPFDGRFPPVPCIPEGGSGPPGWDQGNRSAQGFVEGLSRHRYLTAEEPSEVEVAGYDGLELDVVADVPASCNPHTAMLWVIPPYPNLDFVLLDGLRARFTALEVDGDTVILEVSARVEEFDAVAEQAALLLETMSITP